MTDKRKKLSGSCTDLLQGLLGVEDDEPRRQEWSLDNLVRNIEGALGVEREEEGRPKYRQPVLGPSCVSVPEESCQKVGPGGQN